MRKIILPAALSLLLLSTVSAQVNSAARPPEAAWQIYTFTGEEFSVALPEMPVLDHSSRPINGRPDEYEKTRNYGAYGDGVVYLLRAYDKPRAGEDFDYFAKNFMGRLLNANLGIEIKAQREMTLGKFPGRQYIVRESKPSRTPDSSIYVFLTRRHAYALRAVGGDDNHPGVQRFLTSFALAAKPVGRQVVDEIKLPRTPVPLAVTPPEKKTSPEVAPESKTAAPRIENGGAQEGGKSGGG
ncbi:MAG TPA: hypothetical protein VGB61_15080, partial [Pyrinomonadaceae bacterium]